MRQVLRIFYETRALFIAKTGISPANRELPGLAAGQRISMPGMRAAGSSRRVFARSGVAPVLHLSARLRHAARG
jgi:hypothetical protein